MEAETDPNWNDNEIPEKATRQSTGVSQIRMGMMT